MSFKNKITCVHILILRERKGTRERGEKNEMEREKDDKIVFQEQGLCHLNQYNFYVHILILIEKKRVREGEGRDKRERENDDKIVLCSYSNIKKEREREREKKKNLCKICILMYFASFFLIYAGKIPCNEDSSFLFSQKHSPTISLAFANTFCGKQIE